MEEYSASVEVVLNTYIYYFNFAVSSHTFPLFKKLVGDIVFESISRYIKDGMRCDGGGMADLPQGFFQQRGVYVSQQYDVTKNNETRYSRVQ